MWARAMTEYFDFFRMVADSSAEPECEEVDAN